MKRDRSDLQFIKDKVDFTYHLGGNDLFVDDTSEYDPDDPRNSALGYCFKIDGSEQTGANRYSIVTRRIGREYTDFRILLHEYGHIYLGHLDGLHEELDAKLLWVLQNERAELAELINKECQIDYGDRILQRLIDDPSLNHSIHNIAMDMEVNSVVLSAEDVEEMENDITEATFEKKLGNFMNDPNIPDEVKKKYSEKIQESLNSSKVKLIVPSRYHYPDGTPFEDGCTYAEYFLEIITHPDQFIKMLVNIFQGGNGDTSGISSQQVSDALKQLGGQQGQGNGSGDSQQDGDGSGNSSDQDGSNGSGNGSGGMEQFDKLLEKAGVTTREDKHKNSPKDGESSGSKYHHGDGTGNGEDEGENKDGNGTEIPGDHFSSSRQAADEARQNGTMAPSSGAPGCSPTGTANIEHEIDYQVDPIDMAIEKVMTTFKSRVLERKVYRDVMRKYNRGINRQVIKPTYRFKLQASTQPTIVFCIDTSGSMDRHLIDRILKSISVKMKKIQNGLKYNIIAWDTELQKHFKDIDPKKPVPSIPCGGGTRLAGSFKFFREHYTKDAAFILISDFEDDLDAWHRQEETMNGYTMWGFNYGYCNYDKQSWKNFKVLNFSSKDGY